MGKSSDLLGGLIVASFGRQYLVETADGRLLPCTTYGKKGGAVCGDRVTILPTSADQGVIETIEPRRSLFYRASEAREKLIAANVSQVVIVLAAVPSFYEELLNRCLVAAEVAEVKVLIVLNKADLAAETAAAAETLALYAGLGYPVLQLSAHGDVSALRARLAGETSVLVGQSGMGKTSLVNALVPDAGARTAEVSAKLDSGRHTTTHARLYHLDEASDLIDSPGLQEFGLGHADRNQIERAFPEFRSFLGHCKFNDCRHASEPGCAILEAVADGRITRRRYEIFQRIIQPHLVVRR